MRSELELAAWDRLSEGECEQFARRLSVDLPSRFQFAGIFLESCGEIRRHVAHWKVEEGDNERIFTLVPGGEIELGFDPKRKLDWSPEQLQDWTENQAQCEFLGEIPQYLESFLSPLRRVQIRPMLVEIQPGQFRTREITEAELMQGLSRTRMGKQIEAEVLKAIRPKRKFGFFKADPAKSARQITMDTDENGKGYSMSQDASGQILKVMDESGKGYFITHDASGFRFALEVEHPPQDFAELEQELEKEDYCLLSHDEWEHACSGGTRTLFRWGDQCPADRDPRSSNDCLALDHSLTENALNAFGLLIAFDSYVTEPCRAPYRHIGGDGGEAMHTGFGRLPAWLTLANSYWGEEPNPFFPLEWVRRAYAIKA